MSQSIAACVGGCITSAGLTSTMEQAIHDQG
jgi:hypothetical protein